MGILDLIQFEIGIWDLTHCGIGIWDLIPFEIGILGFQDPPPLTHPYLYCIYIVRPFLNFKFQNGNMDKHPEIAMFKFNV